VPPLEICRVPPLWSGAAPAEAVARALSISAKIVAEVRIFEVLIEGGSFFSDAFRPYLDS
jgi:hypothetical protein